MGIWWAPELLPSSSLLRKVVEGSMGRLEATMCWFGCQCVHVCVSMCGTQAVSVCMCVSMCVHTGCQCVHVCKRV